MDKDFIIDILLQIKEQIFPAQIWNMEYLQALWEKYCTVGGFLVGLLFIVMLMLASDFFENVESMGTGRAIVYMFKVLWAVVFANALYGLFFQVLTWVSRMFLKAEINEAERWITGAFNPLSMLVVCLVVTLYYNQNRAFSTDRWRSFCFGIAAFGINAMLFGALSANNILLIAQIIRIIIAAIICVFCAKCKRSYGAYILMSCFFIVSQVAMTYVMNYLRGYQLNVTPNYILGLFKYFRAEYIIIISVIVIWILLERLMLRSKKSVSATK